MSSIPTTSVPLPTSTIPSSQTGIRLTCVALTTDCPFGLVFFCFGGLSILRFLVAGRAGGGAGGGAGGVLWWWGIALERILAIVIAIALEAGGSREVSSGGSRKI